MDYYYYFYYYLLTLGHLLSFSEQALQAFGGVHLDFPGHGRGCEAGISPNLLSLFFVGGLFGCESCLEYLQRAVTMICCVCSADER